MGVFFALFGGIAALLYSRRNKQPLSTIDVNIPPAPDGTIPVKGESILRRPVDTPAIFLADVKPRIFSVGTIVHVDDSKGEVIEVRQDGVTWSYLVTVHGRLGWMSEDSLTLVGSPA